MDMPPFEKLRELAEHDPRGFEALRTELIEDCINGSPTYAQKRLRGLQFVIDSRRGLASNPVHALVQIQSMMHEALERLGRALSGRPVDEPVSCHILQAGWSRRGGEERPG